MSDSTGTPLSSESVICTKCGKVLFGNLRHTGDSYCICRFESAFKGYPSMGWICPRCQRVNSPTNTHCNCSNPTLYKFSDEYLNK